MTQIRIYVMNGVGFKSELNQIPAAGGGTMLGYVVCAAMIWGNDSGVVLGVSEE